jgi:hypothetical protein
MKKMTIATLTAIAAFGFSGTTFASNGGPHPVEEACCPLIEVGDIDVNDIIVGVNGTAMKVNGNNVDASVNASQSISQICVVAGNVQAPATAVMPLEEVRVDRCGNITGYSESLGTLAGNMTVNQSSATFDSSVGANIAGASFQAFSSPTVLVVGGQYAPSVPSAD